MPFLNYLTEPLSHTFIQHALIAAVAVGAVCAALSCFVVLKGWSLMGDAVSHAVLPGVVLSWWLGMPMFAGAFAAGLFCAFSAGYLNRRTRIKEDTLMGIVFIGMFAAGLILADKTGGGEHLKHILFGNLLGIGRETLYQTLAVCGAVLLVLLFKGRDFLLYCFDPGHARVAGLSPRLLHYTLLALLSATVVAAMSAVGVILVVAMLITPGLTALLLCRRFHTMLAVAAVGSCLTAVIGVLLSFHLDSATGATIVLTQSAWFAAALAWTKFQQRRKPEADRIQAA